MVTLVFSGLGLSTWAIVRQMSSLSTDLITYRANIRQKVRDVRGARRGGSVEKLQSTLDEIKKDIGVDDGPRGTVTQPVVVSGQPLSGFSAFSWMGPFVEPASTAGFVVVLVLFMLLEREELRDRLIGLIGHGHLAVTTKAFDEAGSRVSRQLLLQTLVNAIYGALAAAGLWVFGAPYPLFWGAVGAGLRFIPYIGPVIASVGPILISLAALPGWTRPLEVAWLLRPAGVVHEPRAGDRALCRRRGSVAGRSAGGGGLLDLVVGTAGPAHGHATYCLPRGFREARPRLDVRRDHAVG